MPTIGPAPTFRSAKRKEALSLVSVGLPGSAPVSRMASERAPPDLSAVAAIADRLRGAVPDEIELRVRQISQAVGAGGLPGRHRFNSLSSHVCSGDTQERETTWEQSKPW